MDFGMLSTEIKEMHSDIKSWRTVGLVFGVTCTTARRIAEGHEPKKQAIRDVLGLAPKCEIIEGVLEVPEGVTSVRLPDGAKALKCANATCAVWFVRCHPRQRYHRKECRP